MRHVRWTRDGGQQGVAAQAKPARPFLAFHPGCATREAALGQGPDPGELGLSSSPPAPSLSPGTRQAQPPRSVCLPWSSWLAAGCVHAALFPNAANFQRHRQFITASASTKQHFTEEDKAEDKHTEMELHCELSEQGFRCFFFYTVIFFKDFDIPNLTGFFQTCVWKRTVTLERRLVL